MISGIDSQILADCLKTINKLRNKDIVDEREKYSQKIDKLLASVYRPAKENQTTPQSGKKNSDTIESRYLDFIREANLVNNYNF